MRSIILMLLVFVTTNAAALIKPLEFTNCDTLLLPKLSDGELKEAMAAGKRLTGYFSAVEESIVERDYISLGMQRALIGRQPVLLVGPPGNAKTKLVTHALGNIIDEDTGKPSFFTDQMTFETTLSDTHGPLNFKTLMDSGRQERFHDEGILGHYFALLDEQFDMRPNAFRNVLTALQDRRHKDFIGKTWMIVGASNKSIPEVYARFNIYDDSARALVDRYAFVFYVGAELIEERNNLKIIQNGDRPLPQLPKLSVQDLKKLNALVGHVEIPNHVAHLLSYLDFQLKPILEGRESQSLSNYLEKVARGEPPSTPPWKSTKYMSPRTLGRAATILRSSVILDWVEKGGKRDLVASIDDLQTLMSFYAFNGPKDEDVSFLLTRTTKDTEKDQLATVQLERKIFAKLYDEAKSRFNQAMQTLAPVQDLMAKARSIRAMRPKALKEFEAQVRDQFLRAYAARNILETTTRVDLTPELMGQDSIYEVMLDLLKLLNPDVDKLKAKLDMWIAEMGSDPKPLLSPPASIVSLSGNLRQITAGELETVPGQGIAFVEDTGIDEQFHMSPDGQMFYSKANNKLNLITSTHAAGPISWALDFESPSLDGKILYSASGQPFHIGSNFRNSTADYTMVNSPSYQPDSKNIFFVNEAARQIVALREFSGRAQEQLINLDTNDFSEGATVTLDIELNESNDTGFSWQASDGNMYTFTHKFTNLYRYTPGQKVAKVDTSTPQGSTLNFVGRIGDSVFLINRGLYPQQLHVINPVARRMVNLPLNYPLLEPSPVWVSRWGSNDVSNGQVIKLWSYEPGSGLTLVSFGESSATPVDKKLILTEADLSTHVGHDTRVAQIFEDADGNVLLITQNEGNLDEISLVKIPVSLFK